MHEMKPHIKNRVVTAVKAKRLPDGDGFCDMVDRCGCREEGVDVTRSGTFNELDLFDIIFGVLLLLLDFTIRVILISFSIQVDAG